MTKLTNSGLVLHCFAALKLKTKYMWGGLFRELTTAYILHLFSIYGSSQYTASRIAVLKQVADKDYYGCDCIGLIKSYYFGGFGAKKNAPGYKSNLDYNVGGMYNAAKIKGKIATMPDVPGLLVMTSTLTHVGVYIGGGYVIECTLGSRGDGVVKTKLSAGGWGLWCQCPVIEDDTNTSASTSTTAASVLTVGDTVKVIAPYASSASYSSSASNTKAIGGNRYIVRIIKGAKFPYQLGVKKGSTAASNTTGFAIASALKKC